MKRFLTEFSNCRKEGGIMFPDALLKVTNPEKPNNVYEKNTLWCVKTFIIFQVCTVSIRDLDLYLEKEVRCLFLIHFWALIKWAIICEASGAVSNQVNLV